MDEEIKKTHKEVREQIDREYILNPLIKKEETKKGRPLTKEEKDKVYLKSKEISKLNQAEKDILRRIKKAYCPEGIADDNPILQLARLVVFPQRKTLMIERKPKFGGDLEFDNYEALESVFLEKKLHPLDLKNAIGRDLASIIEPIRAEYEKLAGK